MCLLQGVDSLQAYKTQLFLLVAGVLMVSLNACRVDGHVS